MSAADGAAGGGSLGQKFGKFAVSHGVVVVGLAFATVAFGLPFDPHHFAVENIAKPVLGA